MMPGCESEGKKKKEVKGQDFYLIRGGVGWGFYEGGG